MGAYAFAYPASLLLQVAENLAVLSLPAFDPPPSVQNTRKKLNQNWLIFKANLNLRGCWRTNHSYHITEIARLQPPRLSQSVHREECTQCFDNKDSPLGIDVCLTCFNGGCLDKDRHHARTHVAKTGHTFTLNVKRKLRPSANRTDEEEPPAKMKKLAIVEEREEDKYEYKTVLKCWNPSSTAS
ncbi:hypothetical protein NUW54_g6385 [Trametes sanguinea]|uniref:Uncharacterized protein n=1 Tax=Trametes sanguinea TaxID=158606 RepID=A0ACC1PTK4_9APHY|nr:hypothetical protein NUW54_g6385 [Trametes sanguinea]